jgi:amidase
MSARPGEQAPTTWYLFSVGVDTPPAMTIDSGQEVTLEVRGAFADVRDIRDVPTPFTPACDGHPLAPIAGPVRVRGAEPGDAVAIDLLEITPHGDGITAILRDFGVLRKEYGEPKALVCPVRDGRAWFGGRIPIPLNPNLGTVSTMPPEGYKPSYAGPYGGDFDQKDVKAGSRVHLPVMVPGALVFFADPHAAISDGIVTGTGVECTSTVRARITLHKGRAVARPIVEVDGTVQVLGFGPSVEEATEDATRAAIDVVAQGAGMDPEEAYMLLSIVGELRIGTSPRPVMAARLIIPRETLAAAGWSAPW